MKNYGDADNDCVRQKRERKKRVNNKKNLNGRQGIKPGEMLVILWRKLSTFAMLLSLILSLSNEYLCCSRVRETQHHHHIFQDIHLRN